MAKKLFTVEGMQVTTPRGVADWCHIKEPRYDEYNPKGVLMTNIVFDPTDEKVKEFVSKLEKLRDAAFDQVVANLDLDEDDEPVTKAPVFKKHFDSEKDDDGNWVKTKSGKIMFTFKKTNIDDKKAEGKSTTIELKGADLKTISPIPLIGNGSVLRCVGFANPYFVASSRKVGVSLNWTKAQLLDLVVYDGPGGDGDLEVEEGYTQTVTDSDGLDNADDNGGDF